MAHTVIGTGAGAVARLPATRRARPLIAGAVVGSVAVSAVTNGLSLVVLALFGAMMLLFAWGCLTGWAGVWARYAQNERDWAEAAEQMPLGRTRVARGWISFTRQDDEYSRGMTAVCALLTAVAFIALGIAGVLGAVTIDL